MNDLIPAKALSHAPALIAASGESAGLRFLEFFASNIRNRHTRLAYSRAVGKFLAWCEAYRVRCLADVQPLHVRDLDRGANAGCVSADRQAAPGRNPSSLRLVGGRPDRAGESGRLGARA